MGCAPTQYFPSPSQFMLTLPPNINQKVFINPFFVFFSKDLYCFYEKFCSLDSGTPLPLEFWHLKTLILDLPLHQGSAVEKNITLNSSSNIRRKKAINHSQKQ